ncbi:MAG: hypothetical protein K0S86_3495 [Geminicoccaceae bacterium]|jgi:hypothetical protein|nr:hypothetical protein [Geminicoccaceae bacterium]
MLDRSSHVPLGAAFVAMLAFGAAAACRGRESSAGDASALIPAADVRAGCAGDSLHPGAAAPARGLWVSSEGSGSERVAVMIGPASTDSRTLAVVRPVESLEVTAAGDTLRAHRDAAAVRLALLPRFGAPPPGGTTAADSAAESQAVATYEVSSRVSLAAYEPCAVAVTGSRVRYLRRDAAGAVVTDVMLHRSGE